MLFTQGVEKHLNNNCTRSLPIPELVGLLEKLHKPTFLILNSTVYRSWPRYGLCIFTIIIIFAVHVPTMGIEVHHNPLFHLELCIWCLPGKNNGFSSHDSLIRFPMIFSYFFEWIPSFTTSWCRHHRIPEDTGIGASSIQQRVMLPRLIYCKVLFFFHNLHQFVQIFISIGISCL